MRPPRIALALTFTLVLGVAACGDAEPDLVTAAEDGVAAVLDEQLDLAPGSVGVACPDEIELDPGVSFTCDVTFGPGAAPTPVALGVRDDGTIELRRAVIPIDAAEAFLADELAPTAEGRVTTDCGEEELLVRSVGETFACSATRTADGVMFNVTVEVVAIDGTVRYTVERTTTTAPPTTAPPATGGELPTP